MNREMKHSGVPWLKDIPSNWNVERGKNVLVLQKRPVRESDEVVTCFRDGEVILRSLRRTEGFTMSDKEIGYQGINEGDIVIHGMDGFAGAMGVSKSTGKGSPVLVVCSPKYDAIPQYIIYYLRALAMTDVFIALATGIRERSCDLRWNKISELEFILPSSIEQQKIASFLDRKCAEIDEMIALQEKIVEELKAYRQSVITEAVTKGLNPDVPMKDSGVEWIGEIPEHWRITTIGRLFRVSAGGDAKWDIYSDKQDNEHPYPVYTNTLDKNQTYAYTSIPVYKGDTITVTGRGDIGRAFYRKTPFDAIIRLLVLEKRYSLDCRYFAYFINNVIHFFTNSAAIGQLSAVQVVPYNVCHPSIEEQTDIADYLDTKCTEIDNLISIKLSKIDSLKEYKKSIIYEYVTGKKEVIE